MRAPGLGSDRGEGFLAEGAQGVVRPPGDLAGDGEGGPVAAEPVGDLPVVGVIRRAGAGGALAASNSAQRSSGEPCRDSLPGVRLPSEE